MYIKVAADQWRSDYSYLKLVTALRCTLTIPLPVLSVTLFAFLLVSLPSTLPLVTFAAGATNTLTLTGAEESDAITAVEPVGEFKLYERW